MMALVWGLRVGVGVVRPVIGRYCDAVLYHRSFLRSFDGSGDVGGVRDDLLFSGRESGIGTSG